MQKQTHTQGIERSDLSGTVGVMQRVGVCVGAYRGECECDRRVSETQDRNANCGRKRSLSWRDCCKVVHSSEKDSFWRLA